MTITFVELDGLRYVFSNEKKARAFAVERGQRGVKAKDHDGKDVDMSAAASAADMAADVAESGNSTKQGVNK